ncbi:DUF968 domain-containing protein [Sphingomonas soli]|uniref:DUF968 domain-containing protein n=1 Tax=Sphingomonas soli TaxID=266127 RepID=UPI00083615AE|nr:DUF968 domain-containing protein [Sphingomonas soli]
MRGYLGPAMLRNRHRNAPRPEWKVADAFRQWLRGRPCLCSDRGGCDGRIISAHVDYAGGKGMGTKVADRFCIPLCMEHHRVQHQHGWPAFEANFKINGLEASKAYWAAWPGRAKWEAEHG